MNTTEIDAIIDGCLQHYRARWNVLHEYYDPNLPDLDRVEAKAKLHKLLVEARIAEIESWLLIFKAAKNTGETLRLDTLEKTFESKLKQLQAEGSNHGE